MEGGPPPSAEPAGLYVHIPFCSRKCRYCDFVSYTRTDLIPRTVKAVVKEASLYEESWGEFDTLYLGGGTPSLLTGSDLRELFSGLRRVFSFKDSSEITMEVNPGDVNPDRLGTLNSLGVNRISIGVQSFRDPLLRFLGRRHTGEAAARTLKWAREVGFEAIGADLIYGIPGQSLTDWRDDLRSIVDFRPEHLSCYQLTFESGTPLDLQRRKGKVVPLNDEETCAFFSETAEFLSKEGYEHYEISNFAAAPHCRSRHNLKYWSHVPYLGLGPAAHSFDGGRRRWNHKNLESYLKASDRGEPPVEDGESIDWEKFRLEALFFAFRTAAGMPWGHPALEPGTDNHEHYRSVLTFLELQQLVVLDESGFRPTEKGFAVADSLPGMLDRC